MSMQPANQGQSGTPQERWQSCMTLIKESIGDTLFDAWFSDTKFVSLQDNQLTISVPSHYVRELYEERFYEPFTNALSSVYGSELDSIYYIVGILQNDDSSRMKVAGAATPKKRSEQPQVNTEIQNTSGLNPSYTFRNYCVGDSNRLPYTIAKSIADHPEKSDFNPFFLYGPVGVGKTHLVQAIGIALMERNPDCRVLFVSMRNFQNQYQTAYMNNKVPDFINFYQQNVDVLLIDDIQELSGKKGTIETLFPIFNYLHGNGRKLIFTCDRSPSSLEGIMDRMIDRFKWGAVEMLQKPDLELRKSIVTHKAAAGGLELPDRIISVIAENVTGSVRELEGIIASLILRAVELSVPITEELALAEVRKMAKPRTRTINFDMIVECTAECFRINPDVIFSKSKVRDIADARQVIMYLSSKLLSLSQTAIGQRLKRQHSTVLHGIRAVANRLPLERELSEAVEWIMAELNK